MPKKKAEKGDSGPVPTLQQYVAAFCDAPLTRKAVIDLSAMLAKVVGSQLQECLPAMDVRVGHRVFGGSVAQHHLDAFIANEHMGLQLGVDVKGLNSPSSVGKNWNNRIGDLSNMANNHHQHAPKAVMGGVLAIPFEGITSNTLSNIERAMLNMQGRRSWNNAHSLFEVLALVVISKSDRKILPDFPKGDGPLRIEKFASTMAEVFKQRWPR
jgi:hypothetical protein